MKTKLFLFSIICFCGIGIMLYAQNPETNTERYIERSINDRVYVYDTLTYTVQNKNDHIYKEVIYGDCQFYPGKFRSYDYIFDEIFSPKRKKELQGNTLLLDFYCDSSGNVLEVQFKSKAIFQISLQEIYALERSLLKYKFELKNTCPEKKYYSLMSVYHGWCK
ncbi:hypothetical protein AGMMS50262_17090 [Bacteroidia bacterium]|nr:hypothetical protein AGMMS50262_17090 [Bacteroidia bacterium]